MSNFKRLADLIESIIEDAEVGEIDGEEAVNIVIDALRMLQNEEEEETN